MSLINQVSTQLRAQPRTWLVTGAAGFIGSHLLENLLGLDQSMIGLDDFSTGHRRNLAAVQSAVNATQWSRFRCLEGDIRDLALCRRACEGVDFVLHHAALGSVPLSIEDQPGECMTEEGIGRPLSPYAASKRMNEIDADVFARCYGLATVGLRYFNVFGPRQDPGGAYAAVIPKWIRALLKNEPVEIFGDGETTRDFCYVENVVQANLLAAAAPAEPLSQICNIACGERTSLNQLFATLRDLLSAPSPARQAPSPPLGAGERDGEGGRSNPLRGQGSERPSSPRPSPPSEGGEGEIVKRQPLYREFRAGDVRHSRADISRARERLGYSPTHSAAQGLQAALEWYRSNVG